MKIKVFCLILGLAAVHAYGRTVRSGWPFSAPSVPDRNAVSPKYAGDIIFDSTVASFLGWNGSDWKAFVSGGGIPSQTGNAGKFLTTDGSAVSWGSDVVASANLTSQNANVGSTTLLTPS